MKALKQTVYEGLRLKIDDEPYRYNPTTWDELRQIIEKRYDELGPGTEQEPIEFNDIDISEITSFYDETKDKGIFEKTNFEYIDVSDWDVSNVNDLQYMFDCCYNLEYVGDLSNWDVSHVEDMRYMFFGCDKLKSIGDLSNWDVSNVKDTRYMFYFCEKLQSIGDLSNWNVSNVENMESMFDNCEKLKSVGDLSNWDVSNVKDIKYMFTNSGIKNIPSWYEE